jgi:hypothetical protein
MAYPEGSYDLGMYMSRLGYMVYFRVRLLALCQDGDEGLLDDGRVTCREHDFYQRQQHRGAMYVLVTTVVTIYSGWDVFS